MKVQIISVILIILSCFPNIGMSQQKITLKSKKDNQRYLLARKYETAGKYQEALQIYQQLWDNNLTNRTYYRGVVQNYLHLKRYAEAIQTTEKMLTIKKSFYVEADLGEIYYQFGQPEKAFDIWNGIVERHQKKPSAYQAVANSMIRNRLVDNAIKIYQAGRKNISNKSLFLIEMANLYSSRLDYKNATKIYLEYLEKLPNQFSFVERQLSKLAKSIEETEPIIKILEDEARNNKESIQIKKLLAGLYIQASNYKNALEVYKDIDESLPSGSKKEAATGQQLFLFAKNALRDGAYEYSEQAFHILISKYPTSPYVSRAQLGLAESAHRQHNYQTAIEEYEKLIQQYPKHTEVKSAHFQIGEIKLNYLNDPLSAKESFITILEKFPFDKNDNYNAMFKIAECELRLGDLNKAKNWYQQVNSSKIAGDEMKEKALFELAQIDFWQGNFDVALKKIENITQNQSFLFNKNKKGFFVNDALKLSLFIEEHQQEKELLKEYAECMYLIEQDSFNETLYKLRKMVENNPQSPLADDIWLKIGGLESELGNYQQAITAYRALIVNFPNSFLCDVSQQRIAEIYETKLVNLALAMQEYELLLTNYPESLLIESIRKKIRELENDTALR